MSDETNLSPEEKQAIELMQQLSGEQQHKILQYLRERNPMDQAGLKEEVNLGG